MKWRNLIQREMRDAHEVLLRTLAMCGTVATISADRASHNDRHRNGLAVHGDRFRRKIQQLVKCQPDKITEHDLYDHLVAAQGQAVCNADHRILAYRRRENSLWKCTREPSGHAERTTVGIDDVLAENIELIVTFQERVESAVKIMYHPFVKRHQRAPSSIAAIGSPGPQSPEGAIAAAHQLTGTSPAPPRRNAPTSPGRAAPLPPHRAVCHPPCCAARVAWSGTPLWPDYIRIG